MTQSQAQSQGQSQPGTSSHNGNGASAASDAGAALTVTDLWKIFGDKSDKIIGTPDADLSRKDLQEKTGCVMAVKDVSFEVAPRRRSSS